MALDWAVKDVSLFHPSVPNSFFVWAKMCLADEVSWLTCAKDCVYRHCWRGYAGGPIGMVSMDRRLHVLPMEGLQEIRALDC